MHDLVIRGARIIDGTGQPAYAGDVATDGDRIAQVGGKVGPGRREIRADGAIVTPGFVDIHTHYDAQVWWDPSISPSSWNGVTSVVMGNCGIGFAPVQPAARDRLIGLMETVEEIPSESLRAGIRWDWESFPQYVAALERTPTAIDIGVQVPHAAVRTYVMGERGVANAPATPADLERMAAIVREGIAAGALGFTGTRTSNHRSLDGVDAPGYGVDPEEVIALAAAAAEADPRGVAGFVLDWWRDIDREVDWLRRLARRSGLKVWCALVQSYDHPDGWTRVLERMTAACAAGERLFAQVPGRPIGGLAGLTSSRNPFMLHQTYKEIAALPLQARVARLRDPAFRARLLAEKVEADTEIFRSVTGRFSRMYRLGDPPDYEPTAERSVEAIASARGVAPAEAALDMMLERDGKELLFTPLGNYAGGDLEATGRMLAHPNVYLGLGDGGAHVGRTCDAATTSFMLTHWARDRTRGTRLPLEQVIRLQTARTAELYGLADRGVLAVGRKADVNVIDFEGMRLHAPEMLYDLPAGARRLVQRTDGYLATIVSGVPIRENGAATGAMPGRLIRRPTAA